MRRTPFALSLVFTLVALLIVLPLAGAQAASGGLTVPVTAVNRISGQYFCFLAEPGPQGGLVARQKPVQVGEVIGNDYVVTGGVKAGDRLIVSGIQKLGDGAPVQALAQ